MVDETFERCVRTGETSEQVRRDIEQAEALELTGTPAFLIGRRQGDGTVKVVAVVDGARAIDEYEKAIDAALQPESWSRAFIIAAGIIAVVILGVGLSRRRPRAETTRKGGEFT